MKETTTSSPRRSALKTVGAGLIAGALSPACSDAQDDAEITIDTAATSDLHICRGLNTITEGSSAPGTCDCATAPAHSCAGGNTCAGLGACGTGEYGRQYWVAENDCGRASESEWTGTGGCGVPIGSGNTGFVNTQLNSAAPVDGYSPDYIGTPIWSIARARFEAKMVAAKEAFGEPAGLLPPLQANTWADPSQPFVATNPLPEPFPGESKPPKIQPGS